MSEFVAPSGNELVRDDLAADILARIRGEMTGAPADVLPVLETIAADLFGFGLLDDLKAQLDPQPDEVDLHQRATERALVLRNTSANTYGRTFLGCARTVEALLLMAGLTEQASRVRPSTQRRGLTLQVANANPEDSLPDETEPDPSTHEETEPEETVQEEVVQEEAVQEESLEDDSVEESPEDDVQEEDPFPVDGIPTEDGFEGER